LILGVWQTMATTKTLKTAAYFQFFGTLIFSGSLYLICITQQTIWGAIAPLGGLSMMVSYGIMAFSVLRKN
jgi:uncharacterized membrane protein YgdD (TMEM256/DUF423 family)